VNNETCSNSEEGKKVNIKVRHRGRQPIPEFCLAPCVRVVEPSSICGGHASKSKGTSAEGEPNTPLGWWVAGIVKGRGLSGWSPHLHQVLDDNNHPSFFYGRLLSVFCVVLFIFAPSLRLSEVQAIDNGILFTLS
jgi:hypothetical protein